MAYVKVGEILKQVDSAGTAAIAFNCTDYDMAYSAVAAAGALRKPVILMLYAGHSRDDNMVNLSGFAAIVKELGESSDVPVAVHLDHCTDLNFILKAIECGFTSVMFDGSRLPFEENLEQTKKAVDIADSYGVDVEGELGYVGFAKNNDHLDTNRHTDPEDAALFAKETGITSLAIDIGSAHGVYEEEPNLNLDRLAEINAVTDTPLVLHGGSGISDGQLAIAFENGINKFNFGTNFFITHYNAIREYCDTFGENALYYPLPKFVQSRLIKEAKGRLRLTKGLY